jgi:putative endonuclease
VQGFTSKYKLDRLVYYEDFPRAPSAIAREKELKGWRREKKNALVETVNPSWHDLAPRLFERE